MFDNSFSQTQAHDFDDSVFEDWDEAFRNAEKAPVFRASALDSLVDASFGRCPWAAAWSVVHRWLNLYAPRCHGRLFDALLDDYSLAREWELVTRFYEAAPSPT